MNNTLAERLKLAMSASGLTQAALAEKVGVSQAAIQKLTSGKARRSTRLLDIARALNVQPEWLLAETSTMRQPAHPLAPIAVNEGRYRVEVMDIAASAGPGVLIASDYIETITAIEFSSDQARSLFGGRPPEQVKMITVSGDSMEETLCSGDRVFVDIAVRTYDGDGIYAFIFDSHLHIKRLQMHKDRLLVLSDNPKYREWYIEQRDHDRLYIMAKVLLSQSVSWRRFA